MVLKDKGKEKFNSRWLFLPSVFSSLGVSLKSQRHTVGPLTRVNLLILPLSFFDSTFICLTADSRV